MPTKTLTSLVSLPDFYISFHISIHLFIQYLIQSFNSSLLLIIIVSLFYVKTIANGLFSTVTVATSC